jgi:DNA-binding CsgD family transcriptional regulator
MTTECDPQSDLSTEEVDALFADRTVNGVLLDRSGAIVHVSRGWRAFAQEAGFALPNFGIGQNYLRHCAYADEESARIVEGIAQLLAGRIDFLSFVYPCHSPTERRWFLLLGFPHLKGNLTALIHINVTGFMPPMTEHREPVVVTDRIGAEMVSAVLHERKAAAKDLPVRLPVEANARALGGGRSGSPALSKRQGEVLELMSKGMSNVEIARALAISPNTVKIHVSGILARLGLPSRTQAIHWMLTRGPQDRPVESGR